MKILLIEDEYHAQEYLIGLLKEVAPTVEILAKIDSVEESVDWLANNPDPDLIFMDIQLADGLSFSIFKKIKVNAPTIFVTAFDKYTLEAFKVNSIDYLLKPVDAQELENALDKYERIHASKYGFNTDSLQKALSQFSPKNNFRQRFLIKQGKDFIYVPTKDIAYIYSEDSLTFLMDRQNKRHLLEAPLDQIEKQLDPDQFFRINRKQIVHIESIQKIFSFFNNRLKLNLAPESKAEAIVSRERVKYFKEWVGR